MRGPRFERSPAERRLGASDLWHFALGRPDRARSINQLQTCTGDPNTPANWSYKGSFSGGRAELNGFTTGITLWGRVRKIGTAGQVGDWSDPAQVMVT